MATEWKTRATQRATWPPGVRVGFYDARGVYVRTTDGHDVPWTPSTEDWFAEDWGPGDAVNHPAPNVDEPTMKLAEPTPGTLQYRQENIRAAVLELRAAIVAGEAVRADATLETLRKLVEDYFVAAEKTAGG